MKPRTDRDISPFSSCFVSFRLLSSRRSFSSRRVSSLLLLLLVFLIFVSFFLTSSLLVFLSNRLISSCRIVSSRIPVCCCVFFFSPLLSLRVSYLFSPRAKKQNGISESVTCRTRRQETNARGPINPRTHREILSLLVFFRSVPPVLFLSVRQSIPSCLQ